MLKNIQTKFSRIKYDAINLIQEVLFESFLIPKKIKPALKLTKERGFTLLELLVVVVLLALVSAGAVVAFGGDQDARSIEQLSNEETTKFEMAVLKKALKQFKRDVGHYPNAASPVIDITDEQIIQLLVTCTNRTTLEPLEPDVNNDNLPDNYDVGCDQFNPDTARGWHGAYIDTTGLTDSWNHNYEIRYNSMPRIISTGENGVYEEDNTTNICAPNGGDDIVMCLSN